MEILLFIDRLGAHSLAVDVSLIQLAIYNKTAMAVSAWCT